MSTPPDAKPAAASKPSGSPAARYLFVFLVGLVIGAIAVVMILRAVEARKTWQDRFPTAAMDVMQAHVAQLRASRDANRCNATDTIPHLQALRTVSNDIEPAFEVEGLREDQRFVEHAGKLRAALDASLAAPPLNCAGVSTAMDRIGEACKACHQDFRH